MFFLFCFFDHDFIFFLNLVFYIALVILAFQCFVILLNAFCFRGANLYFALYKKIAS